MREKILSVLALMSISQAFAQDNLINALANNQGKDVQKYYQIKPVFAVGVTDVKDQGHEVSDIDAGTYSFKKGASVESVISDLVG